MIVAVSSNGVIGHENRLPWHLPADLKFFKQKTLNHCIVMGRKTYESIGKPLPKRTNIVLTTNANWQAEGVEVVHSLAQAIELAKQKGETELFVIGGADIFRQVLPLVETIYWTKVKTHVQGDAFLEQPDAVQWEQVSEESFEADEQNTIPFAFVCYQRRKQEQL
ncbi:dihydrofolate reductase [Flexibacter flexilis DSM 6793]|uniref:Dihydrofolate reductase n=2 Tax=Flexibacter flexilis TaxID=998 RepID=A0A1I1JJ30_9BACT|nr:dihydrofolate reductase [Flexibacter flexilis DSM 6793]